jgi:MOSC domain-containing protein YiiM
LSPFVISVGLSGRHVFSKAPRDSIALIANFGVKGDAHAGVTTQHVFLRKKNAALPNLCQVHLISAELLNELRVKGFDVGAGDLGENVTTSGIDLLALSTGARLRLGEAAIVEVTGARTPCVQMNRFKKGLMQATLEKDAHGKMVRKAGIMSTVLASGEVRAGDKIAVEHPKGPYRPLLPV